ncbi:MAG: hypothetical protein A2X36_10535 [Elusimicrobia bacterium GWA2_69_24]|nr:MAG: hypothetical protein A2X36_10535 [Elusimicrobia bacterium GWA2_69_24]HAM58035.1 hypothetical protein [Candidatus Rokubacteria bacterium]
MLVTPIDVLFVVAGLAVIVWALRRRWAPPAGVPGPPASIAELVLTALALVPAAVGPNILVVALTPGMPGMPILVRWVLLPSILLLAAVWSLAWKRGYERVANRIWTGVWVGAAATATLDLFRLPSFMLGLLPANLPRMFGVLILDTMAAGPTPLSDVIGGLYHYWVSACFGLAYALLAGRTRWWGGLIWGLIIEVGMMTTPPMVVAMDTGYFGLKLGRGLLNGVFIGSLIPHISYGIALGVLLERYVRHPGTIVALLRGTVRAARATAPRPGAPARAGRG